MPFRLPTRVTLRTGAINEAGKEVAAHNARRVLLVTDAGLQNTSWPQHLLHTIRGSGVQITVEDGIEPNPRFETIDGIADRAREMSVDLVIGLGGGSVLDAAKAVAMLLKNPGSCLRYEGRNRFGNGSVPFIAIPTTCGTGSEVTWVSVISHSGQQRKLSIKGDAMFPEVALVDPDLLATLPAHLIACTGMDALTHALEAYTVNCSNPISDALAEKAIVLLFANLPALVENPANAVARFHVMRASTLAGMAFSNADVGGVHCLSETLGGLYDIPHGLANAMLLAPVMRSHAPFIQPELAALHRLLSGESERPNPEASEMLLAQIEMLRKQLAIPSFQSLNVPAGEMQRIAKGAVDNNSNGANPRPMDEGAYLEILQSL